jgi:hypothetical protein
VLFIGGGSQRVHRGRGRGQAPPGGCLAAA